ncbi:MAG: glycoside hydrolase family 30 beta sandwich domain-containing protein [Lachnospiraceae bacterium]
MGHFSRYIQPGARRIGSSSYTDELETAAFINPDSSRVAVLLNRSEKPLEVLLKEGEELYRMEVEPHSIATVVLGGEE